MSNTVKAILLLLAAMAVFTVLDTSAKVLTQSLPIPVSVFFRYFIALLIAIGVVWQRGGASLLTTRHPYLQVSRGLLLMGSTFGNFLAMSYLQLAQTAAIFFTIPLWVCALSMPLLGEKVGLRRWMAVAVGFGGVIVIMRPGSAGFHWAMLVSLGNAFLGACYNLATRKVGGHDATETSLFYVCLVGAAASALPAFNAWLQPVGGQWVLLLLMGVAGAAGHLLMIEAHRLAPASTIAPFIYTQIIWMTLSGALVFGQFPDLWTVLGAAVVVASGIYVFNRERQHGVTTAQAVTPED